MLSVPPYQGPKSDHFDGKQFFNQQRVKASTFANLLRWMLTRKPGEWRTFTDTPPGAKPPERVGDRRIRTTFVNHTTFLIQTENLNILTDPVWSERVSPFTWSGPKRHRPPGIRLEDLPPIDLILLSHNHYDHMDIAALKRLHAAHHPMIVTTLGNTQFLASQGIDNAVDMDWWEERTVKGGIEIACVPAEHFSGRGLTDRNRALWGGFMIKTPTATIYFAGDTGFGPQFQQIRDRYAPITLSLLPIGAYRPTWFMAPVHMSPADAVNAHQTLGSEQSLATHFGTFHMADDGEFEPIEALHEALAQADLPREQFWTIDNGEWREIVR